MVAESDVAAELAAAREGFVAGVRVADELGDTWLEARGEVCERAVYSREQAMGASGEYSER